MKELQKIVCQSLRDIGLREPEYINEVVKMATGNYESDEGRDYYNALLMGLMNKGLKKEKALDALASLKDICPEYFL
jgi:non-homologous end joining protein Ku